MVCCFSMNLVLLLALISQFSGMVAFLLEQYQDETKILSAKGKLKINKRHFKSREFNKKLHRNVIVR